MFDNRHLITASLIIGVLALTALVYWGGLNGAFLLDDYQNIQQFYVSGFNWDEIYYYVTHNTSGTLGRPVSVVSILFTGIVHGPGTWGYKYHNLALHLINGLLIFWLLLRLVPKFNQDLNSQKGILIAGIVSGCWLLHPIMVSTVLYAVQRMAELSAMFTLVAVLIYVFLRDNLGGQSRVFYPLAYLGFPLALLLSIFSKENGALIPFYILAVEFFVYGFRSPAGTPKNRLLVFQSIFIALPLLLGMVYLATHFEEFVLRTYANRDFNLIERLMTQLHVLVFYLKMFFLPQLSDMSLYHDDYAVVRQFDLLTGVYLMFWAGVVISMFATRKKYPVLAFSIAWFLASHLLESTLIGLELVFEHRNYLALIGPLFSAVYYLFTTEVLYKARFVLPVYLLLVLSLTVMRVDSWKDFGTQHIIAVTEHPHSVRANAQFALHLYNNNNIPEAIQYLRNIQEFDDQETGAFIVEAYYRCGSGTDLGYLLKEAEDRLHDKPISVYGLNAVNFILSRKQSGVCEEISLDDILSLVQTAKVYILGTEDLRTRSFLENFEGHAYLLKGDYVQGVMHLTEAYNLSRNSIHLVKLLNAQLQMGRVHDAEQLINFLQSENADTFGRDTFVLNTYRERLENIKQQMADIENQKAKEQTP